MGRLSNIVIRFAYVVYTRAYVSLSTFRGLAIETLPGLYLNRFAERYERLLYTALCSLDGLERCEGEKKKIPVAVVGSESYIIAL